MEALHSILLKDSRLACSRKNMAIKLDLSKAYDRISWHFLEFMLHKFWFPEWVILQCISTATISILCNGGDLSIFLPESRSSPRELVITPSLCHLLLGTICSHSESQQQGWWLGLTYGSQSPWLTHIAFADDIVLFGEASTSNAHNIHSVLSHFYSGSGQKIYLDKSIIIAPRNAHRAIRDVFYDFKIVSHQGEDFCYLGYPYIRSFRTSSKLMSCVLKP